jgi:uncharacterized protein
MTQQRIDLLDALRGYALMGLFFIHMVEYFEVYWLNPVPHPLNDALFAIFGGKAYAIFSLLFGISFFILLNNQHDKGVDFRWRFIWRLCLLLGLGYAHSLVYGGDILQVLALCGLVLVPLWRASHRVVFVLSLFFLLQGPSWLLVAWLQQTDVLYPQPLFLRFDGVLRVYAEGGLAQLLQTNAFQGNARKWLFMLESGRLWTVLGLSMLGFLLARLQLFARHAEYHRRFVAGLLASVMATSVLFVGEDTVKDLLHDAKTEGLILGIFSAYKNLMLTLASVCLFVVLYHSSLQKLLSYLAAPGRMTLSIYVGQSLLCVPIFYGFGLGGWAYLGQVNSFLLGVFLWAVQIAAAAWWFRHYRYGPLEWLWRAATYTRLDIPFTLKSSVKI